MLEKTGNLLINWFIKNKRDLPWRNTSDPYKIWLSEIILQQTRVEQGLPYYQSFVAKFPDIESLANAEDDTVMKLWQGLGYYSRARNLLSTARVLRDVYRNKFPSNYEEILKLKGIGDYTAAAIASFAFNLKRPVLDGNVYRWVTRVFGIETAIDKSSTKKAVMALLNAMMESISDPALFNQAAMEFGALQCTPQNPKCPICPLNEFCVAFKDNKTSMIPVKGKAVKVRDRYLHYFVFITKNKTTYIKKREDKDIWQGLYDFPLIESVKPLALTKITRHPDYLNWVKGSSKPEIEVVKPAVHKLSHQNLFITFYIVNNTKFLEFRKSAIFEIEINTLNSFAVPEIINKFLHGINFNLFKNL
jgi:A/G-specific adenine glycosylase